MIPSRHRHKVACLLSEALTRAKQRFSALSPGRVRRGLIPLRVAGLDLTLPDFAHLIQARKGGYPVRESEG